MLQALRRFLRPSISDSLANTFSRLGWIGFWIQIAIGLIPLTLIIYAFVSGQSTGAGTRRGLLLVGYLTIAGFLVLIFTTVWSYRYTRLAERISDSTLRPSEFLVQKAAWIGVASSALGIVFSMLVILFEVAQLLIYFLRAPQAGVPVIQTTGGGQASWVSAADIMHLMALVVTTFGEFTVLAFSLWLLFRTTLPSAEYPHAGGDE
jgi:Protein of unknown function (DUF3611)